MLKFFKWLEKGWVKEMWESLRSNARQEGEREMHDLNKEPSENKRSSSVSLASTDYFSAQEDWRDVDPTVHMAAADNADAEDVNKEVAYNADGDDVAADPGCSTGESREQTSKGHRGRKRKIFEDPSGTGVSEDGGQRVESLAVEARPWKILRSRTIASTSVVKQAQREGNARDHQGKSNIDQSDIIITKVEADMPKLQDEKSNHKKEGEMGRNTEKQLLRNRIISILKEAGWTIQYRPRKSKEYLDAVYVDHQGKTYWSVTLAYKRLKEMVENGTADAKATSAFTLIPEDELRKLYRRRNKYTKPPKVGGSKTGKGHDKASTPNKMGCL